MKTLYLSEPAAREDRHNRQVTCRGFARKDGLLDIEGELIDTKAYDFPSSTHGVIASGTPVHHMQVRITIDFDMVIQHAEAVTVHGPYAICPKGADNITGLIGLQIGPGWKRKVQTAIGGPKGCTHITELMGPMATTAFQTLYGEKARQKRDTTGADQTQQLKTPLPSLTNSCIAYAEQDKS
ncbi:MAG: hypothetical protein CMN53_03480 [SAR116 cluster bacterium]|nr:hypothetical protein [SAR116 cluster bacterium]